jgi:hypothetical protein
MQSKDTPTASDAATSALAPQPSAPAPSSSTGPEKRTPAEWAAKRKLTKARDPRLPQSTDWVHPSHAVADKLYGWSEHAYHFQAEDQRFLLTEADYVAGLQTAGQFPTVAPHAPAMTPTAAPRFADFEPSKSRKKEKV